MKWPIRARPTASRLCKAYLRRTNAADLQRSSRRSVEINGSSCRASGIWQQSMIPSAEQGCMTWDEATGELKRCRTAAMVTAEQLSLLARMLRALLRHRRGSKAGRYYRRRHSAPKVLNLEELWLLTTCSASKSSGEAEVCGQMARAAAAKTAHDHSIGADRQRNCIQRSGDSIEMIL